MLPLLKVEAGNCEKSHALISGVIAALVLILFSGVSLFPKNSQSFLAVVAICVTFAVLALAIPANLFSWLRGKKGKARIYQKHFYRYFKEGEIMNGDLEKLVDELESFDVQSVTYPLQNSSD